MSGSYTLTDRAIDDAVAFTSPGNYALGYLDGNTFTVFYVGRSDCNVRQRLHDWVGAPSLCERYASSCKAPWGTHRQRFVPLAAPCLARVSSCPDTGYTHFAFSYASSPETAFQQECRNYDDFGRSQLDNPCPPVPPQPLAAP